MLHSLTLPPYNAVKHLDGTGNFAVKKYYQWPFSFFYQKKLKMILEHFESDRTYSKIFDYGAGAAHIFEKTLGKYASQVFSSDWFRADDYDVIVCASVLEFAPLDTVVFLKRFLKTGGFISVASPMDTWITRLYFKLIGDKHKRNSHQQIYETIYRNFTIVEYKEWFGIYFSIKASIQK